MGLVLVQVTHHGPAEQTGLSKTVPLIKERLHDVGDEPWGDTTGAGLSPILSLL